MNKLLYFLYLVVVLLFTFCTINQNKFWKDNLTVNENGINKAPNSYNTHKSYGLLLSNMADNAISQEEKNNLYNQTGNAFIKSLDIYPAQQDIWYMYGRCSQLTNHIGEAKKAYLHSIERFDIVKIESLYNLGLLFENVQNYDSSMIYYLKVADIDSAFKNVYGLIGRIYLYKNDLNNSLNYLKKSLMQDSTDFSTLSNIGSVYYYYKDYDKALNYYLKSVKYNKDFCFNYKNIGACWYQKKNYKKALEYYNMSYKCKPDNDVLIMINSLKK